MRTIHLALFPVVSVLWLGGCALQPGDDPVEDQDQDRASQVTADLPASPERALDGRAAVAAGIQAPGAAAISPASLASSWFSGSIAPGASQNWVWNNASVSGAYKVGLSPIGASTTAPCQFQVTRTWDVQQPGGEHEFRFTIKNTGTITCGTTVLLAFQPRTGTWETGGIDIGQSREYWWNHANPLTATYIAGVAPSGATSSSPCVIELTRSWYEQQPSGEREFHFLLKNIGDIACQGDIQLAQTTSADSSWPSGSIVPGAQKSWVWNHANPIDRVYVPGLSPTGGSGITPCVLEVTQSTYQQLISDGIAERRFFFTVKNSGSLTCAGTVLLNNVN